MKHVRLFAAVAITDMLMAVMVYTWLPSYRNYLTQEDNLVENLTALLFLAAGIVGLYVLCRERRKRARVLTAGVSALGFLGFLDEVSFGERLFGLAMPLVAGVKIDAAHDVFELAYKMIRGSARDHEGTAYLLLAVPCLVVLVAAFRYGSKLTNAFVALIKHPPSLLFMCSALLVLAAIIIDLQVIDFGAVFMTEDSFDLNAFEHSLAMSGESIVFVFEEMFELNAGVALLLCCLSMRGRPDADSLSPR